MTLNFPRFSNTCCSSHLIYVALISCQKLHNMLHNISHLLGSLSIMQLLKIRSLSCIFQICFSPMFKLTEYIFSESCFTLRGFGWNVLCNALFLFVSKLFPETEWQQRGSDSCRVLLCSVYFTEQAPRSNYWYQMAPANIYGRDEGWMGDLVCDTAKFLLESFQHTHTHTQPERIFVCVSPCLGDQYRRTSKKPAENVRSGSHLLPGLVGLL